MHTKPDSIHLLIQGFQFPVQSVATPIFEDHDYSQPDATEERNDEKYDDGSYGERVLWCILVSEEKRACNISHGEEDEEHRLGDSSLGVASNILSYHGETERGLQISGSVGGLRVISGLTEGYVP
jgi:hypothetical protein